MKYDTLSNLRIETPRTSAHRNALRQALLEHELAPQPTVLRFRRRLGTLQGVKNMILQRKLIAGAGFAALAVVVATASLFSPLNPHVSAMQTTQDSIKTVQALSNFDLAALKSSLSADPLVALKDAANAKDLTKISKADFEKLKAGSQTTVSQYGNAEGDTYAKVESVPGSHGSVSVDQNGKVQTSPSGAPNTAEPATENTAGANTGSSNQSDSKTSLPSSVDAQLAKAVAYVRFTNGNEQVSVIAFDSANEPVYIATFLQ